MFFPTTTSSNGQTASSPSPKASSAASTPSSRDELRFQAAGTAPQVKVLLGGKVPWGKRWEKGAWFWSFLRMILDLFWSFSDRNLSHLWNTKWCLQRKEPFRTFFLNNDPFVMWPRLPEATACRVACSARKLALTSKFAKVTCHPLAVAIVGCWLAGFKLDCLNKF